MKRNELSAMKATPKTKTRKRTAPASPVSPQKSFPWKPIFLILLAFLLAAGFLASTGLLQEWTAGPKTPLPRTLLGLSFGTSLQDIKTQFPGCKARSFNNDPLFKIVTLNDQQNLPEGASEAELIFFEKSLYFVSTKWEGEAALKIPVESWSRQFRRWKKKQPNSSLQLQNTSPDTLLKEWYFADGTTEMVLRNLSFNSQSNRWMDLRDISNEAAQEAFAKYRFDLQ